MISNKDLEEVISVNWCSRSERLMVLDDISANAALSRYLAGGR